MTRKKIPSSIETEVMFLSDMKCCIDNNKGDHIHHIDGNNSNNVIDNLVLLCFPCHNLATITNTLSKKLSPNLIKKYRTHHYATIKIQRENSLKKISGKTLKTITQEDIIDATTTSIILVEIAKIQEEYYRDVKMDRNEILTKLLVFKNHSNPRILIAVLDFLNRVVSETRSGLPSSMIVTTENIITLYFSELSSKTTKQQFFEVGKSAIEVGETIAYDSSIHSANFKSMSIGYSIIDFIHYLAKTRNIKSLEKNVYTVYEELKSQLKRPERNDLENAEKIRHIHFENIKNGKKSNPVYSQEIMQLIQKQQ